MTAFPSRSCWAPHLPHGACGSVFHIGLSQLKAWAVLPSGEDSGGVAPWLHAEGPCETTAASLAAASEHDRVPQAERRVQGPAILASTLSASTPGSLSPGSIWFQPHGLVAVAPQCYAAGTRRLVHLKPPGVGRAAAFVYFGRCFHVWRPATSVPESGSGSLPRISGVPTPGQRCRPQVARVVDQPPSASLNAAPCLRECPGFPGWLLRSVFGDP